MIAGLSISFTSSSFLFPVGEESKKFGGRGREGTIFFFFFEGDIFVGGSVPIACHVMQIDNSKKFLKMGVTEKLCRKLSWMTSVCLVTLVGYWLIS